VAPHAGTVLDIGTGSGCIAIALARRMPKAAIAAVELSPDALVVAGHNAELNGACVEFLQGSFFTPLEKRRFDLIVSNPPYITRSDLYELQPEVRDFEPRLALDGGADGLAAYRVIVREAPKHLNPGGWLLLEVGAGQAQDGCSHAGTMRFYCDQPLNRYCWYRTGHWRMPWNGWKRCVF